MSDGSIAVDFGAVSAAAGDISSIASQVDGKIGDLTGQISNLEQVWEGGAGEGFQHTKQAWLTAAKDLQQTLAKIGTAVHAAHENYTQAENTNKNRWG
jgi:WXG100 family type VII secretion target